MAKKKKGKKITVNFEGVEVRKRIADGEYALKVAEVTQEDGEEYPYLSWKFQVARGKSKGGVAYTNTSLAPKALFRLRGLLEAMGEEIPDGEFDLDLKEYVDKEVGAVIEAGSYEGKPKSEIVDFMPVEDVQDEDEDDDDEKPKKKSSKSDDDEEDEEEEEDKPKKKKKDDDEEDEEEEDEDEEEEDEKVTQSQILKMDEKALKKLIERAGLDVDLDDYKNIKKQRAAVIEALEEQQSGGDKKSYTQEEIDGASSKELDTIVDDEELDEEIKEIGSTKKKRRAVTKALKKADKFTDDE